MADKKRILIVDDEPDICDFISDVVTEMGFDAVAIHKVDTFEEVFSTGFDVIILDLNLPDRDGVELLRLMGELHSSTLLILISGYDSGVLHSAEKLASEHGLNVIATLSKPFFPQELENLLVNYQGASSFFQHDAAEYQEPPTKEELQKAMNQGELQAYFQPQLDIHSNNLAGVEALVRWNHPERGLLMPNVIIPLAEQTGLIEALTTEIIEQSLRQISEWEEQGLQTRVSVNIPANTFKELSFPEWLSERITHYHLEPNQLVLEVTESGLMRDLIKSLDILTRLRMRGIKLSIDDFGTGYSSMVQLYRLPFTEMKIDRSFVMQATSDAEALAIVKMTILLGHELDMTVVAEGIEDEEALNLLSHLGCDVVQGYFIARPMPAAQLIEWFNNRYN